MPGGEARARQTGRAGASATGRSDARQRNSHMLDGERLSGNLGSARRADNSVALPPFARLRWPLQWRAISDNVPPPAVRALDGVRPLRDARRNARSLLLSLDRRALGRTTNPFHGSDDTPVDSWHGELRRSAEWSVQGSEHPDGGRVLRSDVHKRITSYAGIEAVDRRRPGSGVPHRHDRR